MTSVISKISQNPYGVSAAVLSGGNGSNSTTQRAIATIDPRYGNTFTIDTTHLSNSGAGLYKVFILLKAAKSYVGAVLPGKNIHLLFKLPPKSTPSGTKILNCAFDSTIGNNILSLETYGYYNACPAISLIADATQFQLLDKTAEWITED
jgi:hypothetical protein